MPHLIVIIQWHGCRWRSTSSSVKHRRRSACVSTFPTTSLPRRRRKSARRMHGVRRPQAKGRIAHRIACCVGSPLPPTSNLIIWEMRETLPCRKLLNSDGARRHAPALCIVKGTNRLKLFMIKGAHTDVQHCNVLFVGALSGSLHHGIARSPSSLTNEVSSLESCARAQPYSSVSS